MPENPVKLRADVPDHGLFRSESFECPWCHRELVLWAERFKGSGTRIIRARHLHNLNGNCNAPVPEGYEPQAAESGAPAADDPLREKALGWLMKVNGQTAEDLERNLQHGEIESLTALLRETVGPVSQQALVLATDVDDMMGALRCVASDEYSREAARDIAHGALERLKVRGIGGE